MRPILIATLAICGCNSREDSKTTAPAATPAIDESRLNAIDAKLVKMQEESAALKKEVAAMKAAKPIAVSPQEPPKTDPKVALIAELQAARKRAEEVKAIDEFKKRPEQKEYGFFPGKRAKVVHVIDDITMIVVFRLSYMTAEARGGQPVMVPKVFEIPVCIVGVDTDGVSDESYVMLNMPFEVSGTKKLGPNTYMRMFALE